MNPTLAQALVAYLHYLSIFVMVVILSWELLLYRPTMTAAQAGKLMKIDAFYGIAAVLVVTTGFSRALWFAKDWSFYQSNPIFWAKVSVVVLVGLLSIPPTIHFLSFRSSVKAGAEVHIPADRYSRVRKLIHFQLALLPLVPLLAVLMARGIGLPQE